MTTNQHEYPQPNIAVVDEVSRLIITANVRNAPMTRSITAVFRPTRLILTYEFDADAGWRFVNVDVYGPSPETHAEHRTTWSHRGRDLIPTWLNQYIDSSCPTG